MLRKRDPFARRFAFLFSNALLAIALALGCANVFAQDATDLPDMADAPFPGGPDAPDTGLEVAALAASPWPNGLTGCWINEVNPGQQKYPMRIEAEGDGYSGDTWHPNAFALGRYMRLGFVVERDGGLWRLTSDRFDGAMLNAMLDQELQNIPDAAEAVARKRTVVAETQAAGMWMTMELPEGGTEPFGKSWFGPNFPFAVTPPDGEPGVDILDPAIVAQTAAENRLIYRGPLEYRAVALYFAPAGDPTRAAFPLNVTTEAQIVLVTQGGCGEASLSTPSQRLISVDGTSGQRMVTLTETEPMSGIFVSESLSIVDLADAGSLLAISTMDESVHLATNVLENTSDAGFANTESIIAHAGAFSFEDRAAQPQPFAFIPAENLETPIGRIEDRVTCPGNPPGPHLVLNEQGRGEVTVQIESAAFREQLQQFLDRATAESASTQYPFASQLILGERNSCTVTVDGGELTFTFPPLTPSEDGANSTETTFRLEDDWLTQPDAPPIEPLAPVNVRVTGQPGSAIPLHGVRVGVRATGQPAAATGRDP